MKYLSVLLIIFLLVLNTAYSQERLKHEKKFYLSKDGKLYVNRALPIYLKISSSPDDKSPNYVLKSETTPQYTNPMYFDTEGRNTFRSPWAVDTNSHQVVVPKAEIWYQVYADGKAPVTQIKYQAKKIFTKNSNIYTTDDLIVQLTAYDETSGVEAIYYSLNGANYQKYSEPLKFHDEKANILKYYSVDNVGNIEDIATVNIIIDATAPKTGLEFKGDLYNNIISGKTYVSLHCKDTISGIENIYLKLDSGRLTSYSNALFSGNLQQGEHHLIYYAIDNVGNVENENKFDFFVDNTAPTAMFEIDGKTYKINGQEFSSGIAKLKISAIDNKAGVKAIYYSINNSGYKLYEKPVSLKDNPGNLLLRYYVLDYVNNKSEYADGVNKTSSRIPYMDLTGPSLSYSFSGSVFMAYDSTIVNNKSEIHLFIKDNESGPNRIEYQVDNDPAKIYKKPFSLSSQGLHNIKLSGYDNVENVTYSNILVKVDTSGPEIFQRFSVPSNGFYIDNTNKLDSYPKYAELFLSATDLISGIDRMLYSVNNLPLKPYLGPIKDFMDNEKYIVKVMAFDKVGNENIKDIIFYIKK